jgi:hypothetical protein
VSQRPLFHRATHEHGDRTADTLVDVNDEHLVRVAEEDRAAATGRENRSHLHLDHRFVHRENRIRAILKHKQGGKTNKTEKGGGFSRGGAAFPEAKSAN